MESRFTAEDWELVQTRARTVIAQFRAKGASVADFKPLPPIPRSQVDEFTAETGLVLPGDLTDLLTKFSGGWRLYWSGGIESSGAWLKWPVYMGNFGGNSVEPFIGVTREQTLLQRYRGFLEEMQDIWVSTPEDRAMLPRFFPLQSKACDADYLMLRLDESPARVYYLDHELGYEINNKQVVSTGFREFLMGWSNLGYPGVEYHHSWVNNTTREVEDTGAKADAWRAWLADPQAKELEKS